MEKRKEVADTYNKNHLILNDYAFKGGDLGELSDGYHTFNNLYHQRAILFATIVNMNKDKSWKSKKHSDGKYCFDKEGKWFIVGIDTPKGSYTYHYETDKYWDLFKCEELELGKERDGHTEKDVDRLLSLGDVVGDLKHRIRQLSDECERLQYLYDEVEKFDKLKTRVYKNLPKNIRKEYQKFCGENNI